MRPRPPSRRARRRGHPPPPAPAARRHRRPTPRRGQGFDRLTLYTWRAANAAAATLTTTHAATPTGIAYRAGCTRFATHIPAATPRVAARSPVCRPARPAPIPALRRPAPPVRPPPADRATICRRLAPMARSIEITGRRCVIAMLIALKIRNPATTSALDAADSMRVRMIATAPPDCADRNVGSATTARPSTASVTPVRTWRGRRQARRPPTPNRSSRPGPSDVGSMAAARR